VPWAEKPGSSELHNGVVSSVPEVCFDENLNCSFDFDQTFDLNLNIIHDQLGEKLAGATVTSHTIGVKDDGKVISDQNLNCTHDSFGSARNSKCEFVRTNDHVLNGVATGFQKVTPKGTHVPTEDEVIAFGGIAPTMDRSSVRLQRKDNADDEVMGKAMKIAQQRLDPLVTGTNQSSNLSFIAKDSSEIRGLASRLGVSLGKDFQEALDTVDNIKKVE
jgi:hypothetical protein